MDNSEPSCWSVPHVVYGVLQLTGRMAGLFRVSRADEGRGCGCTCEEKGGRLHLLQVAH